MCTKTESHYAPQCHLNKNAFSSRRNSPVSLSGWRIPAGKLFQSRGPAAAKLRSPNRLWLTCRQCIPTVRIYHAWHMLRKPAS